jgi:hypothetical protein
MLLACALMAVAPAAASSAEPAEPPSEEIICEGDHCEALPPEPEDPTPGTLVPNPGNPPRHFSEPKKHGRKHHKSKHHHAKHRRGGARRAERSQR